VTEAVEGGGANEVLVMAAGEDGDEAAATTAPMAPAMPQAVARRLGAAEPAGRHIRKSTLSRQSA